MTSSVSVVLAVGRSTSLLWWKVEPARMRATRRRYWPCFLAVFRIGATEVTVVSESQDVELSFTELSAQDLLGPHAAP